MRKSVKAVSGGGGGGGGPPAALLSARWIRFP